ncbi:MAG: hypothetical protein RMI56_04965 [Sulfolobales archaeon]|nr:hypothetical protein [Sulfolobales archaeon]MDW8083133.1 hypothetical protein [Sulfolobales archaeon]
MIDEKCRNCANYSPHIHFPQVGRCLVFDTGVSESDSCSKFRRISIDDLLSTLGREGSVYCATCGTSLISEEDLKTHSRSHCLTTRVVIDEAIAEESKAAD